MLVSSSSPSAALHPSTSSPPTHSHSSHPSPSFSHRPTTAAVAAAVATAAQNFPHYEPARHPPASTNHFSPRSSRQAIEELRSALNRYTVEASPPGPSGDLPRGRMSAGLTTLGGGNSAYPSATPAPAVPAFAQPSQSADHPTNGVAVGAPSSVASASGAAPTSASSLAPPMPAPNSTASNKRNSPNDHGVDNSLVGGPEDMDLERSQSKRLRPSMPDVKYLPENYDQADPRDLVILISSMLMELIHFNDKIPLHQGRLTRFHSRSPPRISVQDYLQRLTTHATLSPPILLSMVYYIDRLCALYPAFTVSSLTIHRFLIASATVASKGLSDSFWTNKTYARVGGISITELALLELEFLFRVEWRIVPQPEVLVDYYQSLVERCDRYEIRLELLPHYQGASQPQTGYPPFKETHLITTLYCIATFYREVH
ncbi:regulatory cyclin phoB [Aspergillus clavatus NRRL 1]|uniref:Cyclin-dependent protein kinase regulator Pho80 n=1 Tax=Aspergillus clavatus (strain ATCC 1007 / CBS 513.65 / DSM 816 / NCTC 3887 / NRRL 1 / QM 1276 / 107) TaxID=344612 RepID=A1CQV8_ASPCL|nr:cyclin-dependent protein kinase regulator Pho80 [Aspergillus clavatus NRRL 1]EAW08029.1 cyclin-dependent protein kinase regulator Pho80 [Aspergillus clavatus NRRL 1]